MTTEVFSCLRDCVEAQMAEINSVKSQLREALESLQFEFERAQGALEDVATAIRQFDNLEDELSSAVEELETAIGTAE